MNRISLIFWTILICASQAVCAQTPLYNNVIDLAEHPMMLPFGDEIDKIHFEYQNHTYNLSPQELSAFKFEKAETVVFHISYKEKEHRHAEGDGCDAKPKTFSINILPMKLIWKAEDKLLFHKDELLGKTKVLKFSLKIECERGYTGENHLDFLNNPVYISGDNYVGKAAFSGWKVDEKTHTAEGVLNISTENVRVGYYQIDLPINEKQTFPQGFQVME